MGVDRTHKTEESLCISLSACSETFEVFADNNLSLHDWQSRFRGIPKIGNEEVVIVNNDTGSTFEPQLLPKNQEKLLPEIISMYPSELYYNDSLQFLNFYGTNFDSQGFWFVSYA